MDEPTRDENGRYCTSTAEPPPPEIYAPLMHPVIAPKIIVVDSGCWIWIGQRHTNGYGKVWSRGRLRLAHRVCYEMSVGPIPDGLTIDHLCRQVSCVNPRHLEPVTKRENTLRGLGSAALNARKTHCVHGHSLSDAYRDKEGYRHCRTCAKAQDLIQRERRRQLRLSCNGTGRVPAGGDDARRT